MAPIEQSSDPMTWPAERERRKRAEAEVERLRGLIGRATRKLDEGGVMGARELLAKELHG